MKQHVKLYGTDYYLCGLKVSDTPHDVGSSICMQCGYIGTGLLGMQRDVTEYQQSIRKLARRV
jgi:hypothetical protein